MDGGRYRMDRGWIEDETPVISVLVGKVLRIGIRTAFTVEARESRGRVEGESKDSPFQLLCKAGKSALIHVDVNGVYWGK